MSGSRPLVAVLGGGQLGRMLALAGYRLDLRFRFLDPGAAPPVTDIAPVVRGDFDDPARLTDVAAGAQVATYELEGVPLEAAEYLASRLAVYPPPRALAAAQDRVEEKCLFERCAIPTAPWTEVKTLEDLRSAVDRLDLPAFLKRRRGGYDGRGQALIQTANDVDRAWEALGDAPVLVEGLVPFEREISLVAVRDLSGSIAFYPLVENHHRDGILRLTLAPAPDNNVELQAQAETYTRTMMEELDYVGVLAVELFQVGGKLVANEIAPRVHNSGHWTIEGAETSQFENHLRAILGLPLGSTSAIGHSAMVNLIGEVPEMSSLLSVPGAGVHLYGKSARPGRKLGHVTVHGVTRESVEERLSRLYSRGTVTV